VHPVACGDVAELPAAWWSACCDPSSVPGGRLAFAVEVRADRSTANIGPASERSNDRIHVSSSTWISTERVVARLRELRGRWSPVAVVIDPSSPAGSLLDEAEAELDVHEADGPRRRAGVRRGVRRDPLPVGWRTVARRHSTPSPRSPARGRRRMGLGSVHRGGRLAAHGDHPRPLGLATAPAPDEAWADTDPLEVVMRAWITTAVEVVGLAVGRPYGVALWSTAAGVAVAGVCRVAVGFLEGRK